MTKLIITIDLDNSRRPSADELAQSGFENKLEYWIDYAHADPPDMFHWCNLGNRRGRSMT